MPNKKKAKAPRLIPHLVALPRVPDLRLLAHTVAEGVTKAIVYGELPEGARITEEVICSLTGASRSPVREALQQLERNGLVTREPRRGTFVSVLSIDHLNELYICRIPLETVAARLAAHNATDEEIEAIHQANLRCAKHAKASDILAHFAANVEMSRLILYSAHNHTLTGLLESIEVQATRYRFIAYQNSAATRQNSVRINSQMVAALQARDEEKASQLIREGIENSHAIIRECLLEREKAQAAAAVKITVA